jgi:hypothetical protein
MHVRRQKQNLDKLLTQTLEARVVFADLSHVDERNEGLVSRLNQKEFERVVIERDALERSQHRMQSRSSSHYYIDRKTGQQQRVE